MTPTWPYRVGDYETFMRDEINQHIRNEGIQIIGYRALAELLPDWPVGPSGNEDE